MIQSNLKLTNITFKFFLHPQGFSFSLGFCLQRCLHALNALGHVLLDAQVFPESANFNFSLLVEFQLSSRSTTSIPQSVANSLHLLGKVSSLLFCLSSCLSFSIKFFFKFFNSSLMFFDSLCCLGYKRLFIIKL